MHAWAQVPLPGDAPGGNLLQTISRNFQKVLQGGYQDPFFAVIAYKQS